jgi:hypothetical protein
VDEIRDRLRSASGPMTLRRSTVKHLYPLLEALSRLKIDDAERWQRIAGWDQDGSKAKLASKVTS